MDSLASYIANKRTDTKKEFGGKKYVKRGELEEARLKKRLEEESATEQKRDAAAPPEVVDQRPAKKAKAAKAAALDEEAEEAGITLQEVFRRLRALEQPVTLFGEDDTARRVRLRKAAASLVVADDQRGGQQNNELLAMQRANRKAAAAAAVGEKRPPAADRKQDKPPLAAKEGTDGPELPNQAEASTSGRGDATTEDGEGDAMMATFRAAAEALKAKQAEKSLTTEQRILRHLKKWCKAWEEDLAARPAHVQESGPGARATTLFKQTTEFFKPLYRDLRNGDIVGDVMAGLWMIVEAIENRNYLHAYDIYMRLAVGNAPWPIGVTSVGIHERSSREKISHVTGMNVRGEAHVMNDEATRKWLQAIKRLLTFMQRRFPTDPSRSVDFDGHRDAAYGAAGAGSDKLALLDAEKTGNTWREQGLQPAPHFMDSDGSVKVPQSWSDMVRNTVRKMDGGPARSSSPPVGGRSSPALGGGKDSGSKDGGRDSSPAADTAGTTPASPLCNKNLAAAASQEQQRPGSPLRPS